MTIDEAITILGAEESWKRGLEQIRRADAIKLGIEALKAMKNARSLVSRSEYRLFPGETEE